LKKLVSAFAFLVLSTLVAWADPAGTYDVKGTDLDGRAMQARSKS
jgi:hypothetical protein